MSDLDTLKSMGFSDQEIDNLTPEEYSQLSKQLHPRTPATPEQKKQFQAKADASERAYSTVAPHRASPDGLLAGIWDGVKQLPNTSVGAPDLASVGDFGSSLLRQAVGGDEASAKIQAFAQGGSDGYNQNLNDLQREIEQAHERSPFASTVMPAVAQGLAGVGSGVKAVGQQLAQGGLKAAARALAGGAVTGYGLGAGGAVANMQGTPGLDQRTLDTAIQGGRRGAAVGGALAATGLAGKAPLPEALTRPRTVVPESVSAGVKGGFQAVGDAAKGVTFQHAAMSEVPYAVAHGLAQAGALPEWAAGVVGAAPPLIAAYKGAKAFARGYRSANDPFAQLQTPSRPSNGPSRTSLDIPDAPGPMTVENLAGVAHPEPPQEAALPPPVAAEWLASPHEPQGGSAFKPAVSAVRLRPPEPQRYQAPAPRVPSAREPLELPPAPAHMDVEGAPLAQGPSADLGPFEAQPSGLETGKESLARVAKPFKPATVAKRVEPPTQGQDAPKFASAADPLPATPKTALELPAAPSEMEVEHTNPYPKMGDKGTQRNPVKPPSPYLTGEPPGMGPKANPNTGEPPPKAKAEAARSAANFEEQFKTTRKKVYGSGGAKDKMVEGMKGAPEYDDPKGMEIKKLIDDGKTREDIQAATGINKRDLRGYFSRLYHSGKLSKARRLELEPGWDGEP